MTFLSENKADVATIVVSLIGGLFVYSILSYLLVAQRISISVAVAMSILIMGLTKYYCTPYCDIYHPLSEDSERSDTSPISEPRGGQVNVDEFLFFILFVAIYAIVLAICTSIPKPDSSTFVGWNDIGAGSIIQLAGCNYAFFLCTWICDSPHYN